MGKTIDLTGEKYGKLTPLRRVANRGRATMWECLCDCGNIVLVASGHLRSGHTTSCGCVRKDINGEKNPNYKHGQSHKPLHNTWSNIKRRCYDPKNDHYMSYGGRGIKMCDEWRADSESFIKWSMSNGYAPGLTIDRINVNGDYAPDNCRWITAKEQSLNRTDNHFITVDGETKTLKEWSEDTGIKYSVLEARINRYHWDAKRAISQPVVSH